MASVAPRINPTEPENWLGVVQLAAHIDVLRSLTGEPETLHQELSMRPEQYKLSQPSAIGIALYLLLWTAIYNGYPIVYSDTGEYLFDSFTIIQSPYRSIVYSVFIRFASLGMTPWLVVVAQCAITIYVLRAVFDYMVQKSAALGCERLFFLGHVAFLAFATTLPWFVGQLMPDVFTGLSFLSAFLLLYDSKLSLEKTVLLSVVLAVSVGSHLSHFLSLALVLLTVLVLRAFYSARQFWPTRSAKGIVAFVLMPILASAGAMSLSNWRSGYGFRLSAGTEMFLLNRLMESGLAGDYLAQQCKIEQLTPCKYLLDLPQIDLLWGSSPPLLTEMGGWLGGRGEASRIVSGTIRRYPIRFLGECGKQTLRQFVSFRPGVDNHPLQSGSTVDAIERFYSGDVPKYRLAKQWSGRLSWMARKLDPLYKVVFWISLFMSLVLLINRRSGSEPANRLLLLTLIFLFANALVTGSLSAVVNRYQSRVSWMVSLCCAAYLVTPLMNRWNERSQI
jgi:hypothetical protein